MNFNLVKLNKLNKKPLIIYLVLALVFGIVGFVDIKSNAAELKDYGYTYHVEELGYICEAYNDDGTLNRIDDRYNNYNGVVYVSNKPFKSYFWNSSPNEYGYGGYGIAFVCESNQLGFINQDNGSYSSMSVKSFNCNGQTMYYFYARNVGYSHWNVKMYARNEDLQQFLATDYATENDFIQAYINDSLDFVVDYDNFLTNNNITHTQNDYNVIPDKYNTGVDKSIALTPITVDTTLGTVTSNDSGSQVNVQYRSDADYYCINWYANQNLAEELVIENCDFTYLSKFTTTNIDKQENTKTIIFNNCKFKAFTHSPLNVSNLKFVFNNCTFYGCINASEIQLNNCLIQNTDTDDAIKATVNVEVNNCYISNLMNVSNSNLAHADGVQFTGGSYSITKNVHFNNVRFSFPQFYWDGTNNATANAAIMLSMENSDADNITFENIIIDMGSKYYPIYNVDSDNWNETNIVFKNIKVSNTYDTIFYTGSYNNNATVENVDFNSKLYVSSIWKDDSGKTHIICTNNTKTDKTLKVVTDLGEYSFDIDRSPTQTELLNNATYQTYIYEDMPYDVEFIIEEDINYLVCYDTDISEENQIKYVNYNEEELPEGNVLFRANISSYFEVKLPNSYQVKDLSNTLNFSVSGDIPGNKKLSIGLNDECVLKNSEEQELVAKLSIAKEHFLHEDIQNGIDSTITISVEKLPAGRYVGNMPVYVNIIDKE